MGNIKNIFKNKKSLIAIIVSAVVLLALIACLIVWKAKPKGMVVAVSNLPDSLNPILEQNTSGLNADELIFDGLTNFEVDQDTGKLYTELALAETIEQDPGDKKTYTITLREAYWHDGTPVTAQDVVYSYDAYVLPENKSPKKDYINSFIESASVIDDFTLEIVFRNPIPEFRAYPVLTFKIIPSRFNGEDMDVNLREGENERRFATEPVGTGPFKLKKWEIGKQLVFDANGNYHKIPPKAANLTMKRVIDPFARMNELRRGSVNLVLETNPMDHDTVLKMKGVNISSFIPYAFYAVSINTSLFPKKEGRQAMAYALNREKLVPGITDKEEGIVLNYGPFPSNLFQLNFPEYIDEPLPNNMPFDLKQAKTLAKKGDISGQNINLIYPDSMGEFGKVLAEGIAKQLNEIGIDVDVKKTGDKVFERMVYKEKSYEMALIYHDGFDNVYSSLGELYRSDGEQNITGVSDKQLNALFDKWDKEVTMEAWSDLTVKLYDKICDLSPALYLCTLQKDVYSKGLKNVVIASDNPFLSVEDWIFE